MRRIARCLAAAFALICAAAATAKPGAPPLPPYIGAYQPVGVDERGLWMQADEDERLLRDSPFVIRDTALNDYVREVLCNAVGRERCASVRLYIVRMTDFNASMTPNGTMRIHSGLLLRVRNEAELAAILAHEFAHFEERHGLVGFRQRRRGTDIAGWASVIGGANSLLIQTIAIGSIFSFSRDQERFADLTAFRYLAASSYRSGAFPDVLARMMDEADASALGRKQPSRRYERNSFFASHPTSLERSTNLRKLADVAGNEGDDGGARYRHELGKWRMEFLADQMKVNDFEAAEYLLGQLGAAGWTGDLLVARGDLYRLRGHPRDLVTATQMYRHAIEGGSTDPEAHRGLGLALLRSGAAVEGRAALSEYLRRSPASPHAAMTTMLIEQR